MDIWTREITYKKVRGINVDFSTRKIILQNGRGKKVDFLTMVKSMWKRHGFFDQWNYAEKSTWKRHEFFDPRNYIEKVEMTYKFVQVWSSMYWGDIDVESMWIALGVPVKFTHPLSFILPLFSQNASQLFLPKGLWRFASTISRGSH